MRPYKSKEAAKYFSKNRIKLEDFYESEKFILNKFINKIKSENSNHFLLDIGCAAGGLGNSLKEHLGNKLNYTGIDINPESIKYGKEYFSDLNLINGDFNKKVDELSQKKIDTIISFSCIDWNDQFNESIQIISELTKEKKCDFIFTFRASHKGINNINESYQFVNYENKLKGEIANYVVLSYDKLKSIVKKFCPSSVILKAYNGKPSSVAVTPYEELMFGCIWLKSCYQQVDAYDVKIEGKFPIKFIF